MLHIYLNFNNCTIIKIINNKIYNNIYKQTIHIILLIISIDEI